MQKTPSHLMLRRLTIFSLIAFLIVGMLAIKRAQPFSEAPNYSLLIVTDFVNDWNAGHMIRDSRVADIFNPTAYSAYMDNLWGEKVEWHTWSYPPHLLTFVRPFGYMGYFPALAIWSALGLLGCYWALKQAPASLNHTWRLLTFTSPAFLVNLMHGQTGFLVATLLFGGLYLLPKRPVLAGICFGLLTVKPHLGLLLFLALLAGKQWRVIAVATLTAVAMIGLSVVQWGMDPWISYFTTTRELHANLLHNLRGFYPYMMVSSMPALRLIGIPLDMAWVLYFTLAAFGALATLSIVKREGFTARSILAITSGTLLLTPYGFNYDMPMVSMALAAYLSQKPSFSHFEVASFSYLWFAPALVYLLNIFTVPIVPLIIAATLWILASYPRVSAN